MSVYLHNRIVVTLLAAGLSLLPQLTSVAVAQAVSRDQLWQRIDKIPAAPANARAGIRPTKFQAFTLNATALPAHAFEG